MTIFRGLFYFFINYIAAYVPSYRFRHAVYRIFMGYNLPQIFTIQMGCYFYSRGGLTIGNEAMINRGAVLDSRGGLAIGTRVNISPDVHIYTAGHDPQSPDFAETRKPVVIEDYAWISSRSLILPGSRIGKGAVVAAGSVVTGQVAPYTIVAGNPAKKIGIRQNSLNYNPTWRPLFQ